MPHIHDEYDFTVATFIVHDNKILMIKHPRYGRWMAPGGHVELNENPEEALFREIAEETGLRNVTVLSEKASYNSSDSKPLYTPNYLDVHEANPPHKHIGLVYFIKSASSDARLSKEHDDIRWFSEADLEDKDYALHPQTIFYAKKALAAATS